MQYDIPYNCEFTVCPLTAISPFANNTVSSKYTILSKIKKSTFMKRTFFILSVFWICMSSLAMSVGTTFDIGNLRYKVIDENSVEVGKIDSYSLNGFLEIPASVNYEGVDYTVTSIGASAFTWCNMTKVSIPNTVTTIQERAFESSDITFVDIPNSVTHIGIAAFMGCCELTSVNIPNSVKTIETSTFAYCDKLESVNLSNAVTTIGAWAFSNCSSMTSLNIPSSVESIQDHAFSDCSSLQSLYFFGMNPPQTSIYGIFDGCNNLQTLYVPKKAIADYTKAPFSNYTIMAINVSAGYTFDLDNLHYTVLDENSVSVGKIDCQISGDLNIPSSVNYLGEQYAVTCIASYAFQGCNTLTSVNMPNSVTSIGTYAFESCSSMKTITIPSQVDSIGFAAFFLAPIDVFYFQPLTPPKGASLCFDVNSLSPSIIYVSKEAVNIYKKTAPYNVCTILAVPLSVSSEEVRSWDELYCTSGPEDNLWLGHGVLKTAEQLQTNKPESEEYSLKNLLDGDCNTFFQSAVSNENADNEVHDLQIDLGCEMQHLLVKYAARDHNSQSEPRRVAVFAKKHVNDEWIELGTARFLSRTGTLNMDLANPYRYVKFEVVETFGNMKENGNLFFSWSELGIWNGARINPDMRDKIKALADKLQDVENTDNIPNELIDEADTLKAQLIKGDIYCFYDNGFHVATDIERIVPQVEYIRQYDNTNWQAVYLPFDVLFDEIMDRFDVACLNNVHQYDSNNDGVPERTDLEVFHLQPGETMKANKPYLIRAKELGIWTIGASQVVIQPLRSHQLDCSSVRCLYIFKGVYTEVSGQNMFQNQYYAMNSDKLCIAENQEVCLNPFRWYMAIQNRMDGMPFYAPKLLNIVDMGTDQTTEVSEMQVFDANQLQVGYIYDLNGRLIRTDGNRMSLPEGIYIQNGKTFVR